MMDDDTRFYYVFEDDVNMIELINIDEIIQYEAISDQFFYLGCCVNKQLPYILCNTNNKINGHDVYNISGNVFGLHAVGMSKKCAAEFLEFINNECIKKSYNADFQIDVLLGQYTIIYPANVVRFDLSSYVHMGHKGILFQDQIKFPSSIS